MREIVSPLSGIRSPFGGIKNPFAAYNIGGQTPQTLADFSADKYRANGASTTAASLLTHTRASTATYVDSTGALQTAASGVPRIGHHVWNGSAWVNEGLLVESEARTNLLHTTNALVTQSYTVTAVPHTLHFTGTGTVTLSGASTAGPLVGTGTGEENRVSLTFTPTAASLTLTVSGAVTDAQLEIGSTPSSYIPNMAGSGTVTRAADVMTIPAANLPWPTPVVIGPELVTNGTFDADLSGWSATGNWAWSSGAAVHTPSSGGENLSQSVFTAGKVYQISWEQAGDFLAVYGDGVSSFLSNSNSDGAYTVLFVSQTGGSIVFRAAAGTVSVDNISIREINPLAVSIQMDGRQTGDNSTMIRWYADASNYITQESGASDYTFEQANAGTVDSVTGGSFTSGVNVPYNIASRHGSTFINGAADGTALTADTTPVALPDLSATDLSLAYDYMGTIRTFRVWSDDLGDDGIEEASA